MRVSTAFNRMLALPGAWVDDVVFDGDGLIVEVRLRKRRLLCPCGRSSSACYDRSRRRWRHLDVAASKCWISYEIRRVDCRSCGRVRTEQVPWARPGARHSRDFEDTVAWLCQRTDRTSVTRLLRVSWEAVTAMVKRVVDDHLDSDRLNGLYRIAVDEIRYKRGHYLTVISNHDTSSVVHVTEGRTGRALDEFFTLLGPNRCAKVNAISMDMAPMWKGPCDTHIPQADLCYDPFHVMVWVNNALDAVYRAHRNPFTNRRQWQHTRTALRQGKERLNPTRQQHIETINEIHERIGHAWMLKEQFRALYKTVHPRHASRHLTRWIINAANSGIAQFVTLARRIQNHKTGILAAINHQLPNSLAENINARIRLINKRGYGHHHPHTLTNMIYLCLANITPKLPTQT